MDALRRGCFHRLIPNLHRTDSTTQKRGCLSAMADLTTTFNSLLKSQEAPPTKRLATSTTDEFLKEAHRIVSSPQTIHASSILLFNANQSPS